MYVVVRREVDVDRLAPVEAVAAGLADVRVEQAGHAPVVARELEPRYVQHRHLAHADGRTARGADARVGVDGDPGGPPIPGAAGGRAGRIGRTQTMAERPGGDGGSV